MVHLLWTEFIILSLFLFLSKLVGLIFQMSKSGGDEL